MPAKSSLASGEKVSIDDPRLFNVKDLATILGVDRSSVGLMKKCGFRMPLGGATVSMAHTFLRDNPDIKRPRRSKELAQ